MKKEDVPLSKSEGARETALDGASSDEVMSGAEDD